MGNQKVKWTSEEEEALKAGVVKHGTGKWKNILIDPQFAPYLINRSNIDLKDKWRNMSISYGQCSREKSKASRVKTISSEALSTPTTENLVAEADAVDDFSRSPRDARNAPGYTTMIFEALLSVKDSNGSNIGAIVEFIEQKHEVPQNFRRLLSSKLRRLVLQGKLEKVHNCYKIKDAALGMKTPMPKQKDIRPRPVQNSGLVISAETVENAAMIAAYKIAEADNKSFVAAEAVKEAERVSIMAEDADSVMLLAKEIFEKCSRGETVRLA
ncbi:telomere repeat-binding factor 4-like [Olea europaea var. sylvestris]|uniref:telomere repeat-binding factor 4-like n=1 Tax=Olea europaea var. sylvestris TaxID=158386 RepID=UPI000C1D5E44|nr:telomere repeat-binding factor 4-like [Olea europaea var. sylvestris]